MSKQVKFSGLDGEELERILAVGIDHGGNKIVPFAIHVDPCDRLTDAAA